VNLVDSSGWLEYLGGGPRAGSFSAALEDTEQLLVPTICVTEVCKVLQRDKGEEAAMETLAAMLRGKVIDLDADLAFRAAGIGIEHRIPTADSIILATAWRHEALLWTTDAHFKGLRGVRFFSK
jgi:predicted nucleic acid-binding protein